MDYFDRRGLASAICQWRPRYRTCRMARAVLPAAVHSKAPDDDRCSYRSGSANDRACDPVSRNGPFPYPDLHRCDGLLWPLLHDTLFGRQTLVGPAPGAYGYSRFSPAPDVD